MTPRDRLPLIQIVEFAQKVDEFLEGFAEERFLGDRLRCDAVAMNIFAIGEATLRLSEEARSDLGNFPWEQIRSVRNRRPLLQPPLHSNERMI